MIQKRLFFFLALIGFVGFSACSDDDTPSVDPPATGSIVDPNVGGENQPNQVFVDLSTTTQTSVSRNSWDLGFYTGTEFRVILNNSASALARAIDATDLDAVTAADTVGFASQLDIDAIFGALFGPPPAWLPEAASWTDDPSGDLTKTAIAEVNATASNNQVYIINRGKNPDGTQRGWMKIRVIQNSGGYTLQYASIGASTFSELDITKNTDFDFVFVNLDNGMVSVAPEADDWDFSFTVFTNLLQVDATTSIPYAFKDFILTNANRVDVATVEITSDITYENFAFGSIASLEFSNSATAIGSGWRTVAQPGSGQETGVKDDIFYVIKDTGDNYYKLRFTRLVDATSGERGNPQFQYELLNNE